jgi:dihydropteroate synthase
LVSQVINLSNNKTFKLYREKYNFSILLYHGLYGVELRDIPEEYLLKELKTDRVNIYFINNDLLVTGSVKEILDRVNSINIHQSVQTEIIRALQKFEKNEIISYKIGDRNFDFRFAYIMGILNITPDSFSDGGYYRDKDKAVGYAFKMIDDGADIIDIGGESTRPGSEPVSEEEELSRVIPVINEIVKNRTDAFISIDTTKAKVAEAALEAGAAMVNDISGGTFDSEIFNVVSDFNAAMALMHIKGKPKTMQASPDYSDVVSEVYDFLANRIEIAAKAGIEKIIVDPGIGFGKKTEHNLTIIERLEDFKSLGFPVMIGVSRKSFIGNILNLPVEERDDATNSVNSLALSKGARIIRTHNVRLASQTSRLFNRMIAN